VPPLRIVIAHSFVDGRVQLRKRRRVQEQRMPLGLDSTVERLYLRIILGIELPKSTWYYHQNEKVSYEEKYAHLLPDLEAIALEHPEYGCLVAEYMVATHGELGSDGSKPSPPCTPYCCIPGYL
jgi:hypothetical protein